MGVRHGRVRDARVRRRAVIWLWTGHTNSQAHDAAVGFLIFSACALVSLASVCMPGRWIARGALLIWAGFVVYSLCVVFGGGGQ